MVDSGNMNKIITSEETKSLQQPLDPKTGYSNPEFDKLYPDSKNPFHGTERDIMNKKGTRTQTLSSEAFCKGWDRIFNNDKKDIKNNNKEDSLDRQGI